MISHSDQQRIWDEEHRRPTVLLQMDSSEVSSGVIKFWEWLRKRTLPSDIRGIEMGCGKGRNCIWLGAQGAKMVGFDFSTAAIDEARKRTQGGLVAENVEFLVHDATMSWPFETGRFNFGLDCFTSTDIETLSGRAFARDEMIRVLRPGGYLMLYLLSNDDEFHKEMSLLRPAHESNSFLHTTGKFEKAFNKEELLEFYKMLKLVEEFRIPKKSTFFGKEYASNHFWLVFQK